MNVCLNMQETANQDQQNSMGNILKPTSSIFSYQKLSTKSMLKHHFTSTCITYIIFQ
ncbi:hypothetical protein LguiA_029775 [Lonicera macranthoides]